MKIHKRTRLTPLDREEIKRLYGTREWTNKRFLQAKYGMKRLAKNKFAPRALHLSPRQDRGVLRRRKPKKARFTDFKNTNYCSLWQDHGESQVYFKMQT